MTNPSTLFTSDQILKVLALSKNATAIYATDDIVIQMANDAMIGFWGKDRSVVGKPLVEAVPELKDQPFIGMLQDVLRTGITKAGEAIPAELLVGGKLQTFYYDFEYRAIKNEAGEPYCILHTAEDVTERVLSQQALEVVKDQQNQLEREQSLNEELTAINEELSQANSNLVIAQTALGVLNDELEQRVLERTNELIDKEARLRFTLNAIPQQVWTADPGGMVDYVNQVICDDFGADALDIIGEKWVQYVHPDDRPASVKKWQAALLSGKEYMTEFRLRFADGSYHWHLSRAVPLVADGEITLWLGTNTNIEIQKEKEQQKDEFLSIASHELKTPLTSIKAYNQLMLRMDDPVKLNEFVSKTSAHILRLEKLISDLLDVTKINAGKMNYTMEPFNFGKMLKDLIDSLQNINPDHNIVLSNFVDVSYTGDIFRLEQVVSNFVSNAAKYSPAGTDITVDCRLYQNNIIVSVEDQGIGIAPENFDRLFDRYYRVDNTAMRFEGLGLGLFISSEILRRHNGSFWIESEQGVGSTFYFRLPLGEDDMDQVTRSDTYYKDEHITIVINTAADRMDVDWTGFQDLESVQRGGMLMLDMLSRNRCYKVLNDNTNVLGSWSEAADWAGNEWFPMMERAGLKYFAWIYSPSTFSQLAAKKSVDVSIGNVVTQFFTDIPSAEEWLSGK